MNKDWFLFPLTIKRGTRMKTTKNLKTTMRLKLRRGIVLEEGLYFHKLLCSAPIRHMKLRRKKYKNVGWKWPFNIFTLLGVAPPKSHICF
jgi:hypothetical protein